MVCRCCSCISSVLVSNPRGAISLRIYSLSALPLSFREFTMRYMTPKTERNSSVLSWWSLDPDQSGVVPRTGTSSCLVSISYFSKPFNDVRISSLPKNIPTLSRLNQFCSLLSTNTSLSLRLNYSNLLLALEKFHKEDIFICSCYWSREIFYSVTIHKIL